MCTFCNNNDSNPIITYKNKTPAAEYLPMLKSKYPDDFAKISDILVHFTDEEIYMFINYIFEYEIKDTYESQYLLLPETTTKTKTVLFGLNLFNDIYELKKKHSQNNELPLFYQKNSK